MKELTHEEREELAELEKKLTWQEIIKLREWALIELRIEAKRFMMSDSEIKNQSKNLIDIWAYCVNPEEIKIKSSKEREYKSKSQIELTAAERTGLYELLAMDKKKVIMSFMDGEFHQDETIMTEIKIHMNSFYLLFAKLKETDMKLENENRVKKFKVNYGREQYRDKEDSTPLDFNPRMFKKSSEDFDTERREDSYQQEEFKINSHRFKNKTGKIEKNFKEEFEDLLDEKEFLFMEEDEEQIVTDTYEKMFQTKEKQIFPLASGEKRTGGGESPKKKKSKFLNEFSESMHLLMVVELINLNGDIIIKRNSDIKNSELITLEAINIFDIDFLDVSPDIKEYKKKFSHSRNEIEDINKSLARYVIGGAKGIESSEKELRHIFFPLSKKEKSDELFQDFEMKSRIASRTMFDLALRFKVGEKPFFYLFLEKYGLKYIALFLEKFKR